MRVEEKGTVSYGCQWEIFSVINMNCRKCENFSDCGVEAAMVADMEEMWNKLLLDFVRSKKGK